MKKKDITERIKTFKDAMDWCEANNQTALVSQYTEIDGTLRAWSAENKKDILAYLKLRIITTALNEGWEPTFEDNEERWFGYFNRNMLNSENGKKFISYDKSYISSSLSNKLCFRNSQLAQYATTQFKDIYKEFCGPEENKEIKKYELTEETKEYGNMVLHRVRALRWIGDEVRQGELGGWVEKEENLSQTGKSWISGEAIVCRNARVFENAIVKDNAYISGNAKIYGDSCVEEDARVRDNAEVTGRSIICNYAEVSQNAKIDTSVIKDRAVVMGNSEIEGTVVSGDAFISEDAKILSESDYYTFKIMSTGIANHITWTRSNNRWRTKSFYGTSEELRKVSRNDKHIERAIKYVENMLEDENTD